MSKMDNSIWNTQTWQKTREFIAGSMSGVGLVVAGHPFDTIKVRLQSEGGYGRFKGPMDCLVTTVKEEKIRGLYKGALAPLLGQGFVNASMFGAYNIILKNILRINNQNPNKEVELKYIWMAAACTGSLIFLTVTPMEGIKVFLFQFQNIIYFFLIRLLGLS